MSLYGVMLVVRQEFRVRLRTGRWRWLLGSWVAVLLLFTALLDLSLTGATGPRGVPLFGGLMPILFTVAYVRRIVRSCLLPKSSQLIVYFTPGSMSRTLSFSVMNALPSSLCRP